MSRFRIWLVTTVLGLLRRWLCAPPLIEQARAIIEGSPLDPESAMGKLQRKLEGRS